MMEREGVFVLGSVNYRKLFNQRKKIHLAAFEVPGLILKLEKKEILFLDLKGELLNEGTRQSLWSCFYECD